MRSQQIIKAQVIYTQNCLLSLERKKGGKKQFKAISFFQCRKNKLRSDCSSRRRPWKLKRAGKLNSTGALQLWWETFRMNFNSLVYRNCVLQERAYASFGQISIKFDFKISRKLKTVPKREKCKLSRTKRV